MHPALKNEVPADQRERFGADVMRAQALLLRHQQTGDAGALDASVAAWNAVLADPVFPSAPPDARAAVLGNAGSARFLRSRVPPGTRRNAQADADLDAAVRDLRDASALSSRGSARSNLILALGERYERRQRLDDLDALIDLLATEVPQARSELAQRLWQRFGRRRDITDIDAAIAHLRVLADVRGGAAIKLGMCLMERGSAVDDARDTAEALTWIEAGAAQAESAEELNEVGNARLRAFATTSARAEIDGAIDAFRETVARAVGDRHRPGYLGNLATALLQRWQHAHDPRDLDAAIEAFADALESEEALEVYTMAVVGSPASPLLAGALVNLARALRERGRADDLSRADDLLARVRATIEATDAETALYAARSWGDAELEQERWDRAGEAYGRAQDAIDELVRIQVGRRYKEARLGTSGAVGARAALAFARAGQPRDAAQAIERARARLLSDALEEVDLDRLGRQDLVERYEQAAVAIA